MNVIFSAVVLAVLLAAADAGVLPGSGTMFGAAYGGGSWVVAGSGGNIYSSPNGVDWSKQVSGVSVTLYDVAYCNGTNAFVAVGGSMGIVWSNDGGTKWTVTNTPMTGTADLKSVTCRGSQFVAVTKGGSTLSSDNGLVWQITTPGLTGEFLYKIRTINERFYAVGAGNVWSSSDGATFRVEPNDFHASTHIFDIGGITSQWITFALATTPSVTVCEESFEICSGQLRVPNDDLVMGIAAFRDVFVVAATNAVYMSDTSLTDYSIVATGGRFWGVATSDAGIVACGDSSGSSYALFSADGSSWQ